MDIRYFSEYCLGFLAINVALAGCALKNKPLVTHPAINQHSGSGDSIQNFENFIPTGAKIDKGLFNVYNAGGRYYLEIPDLYWAVR